MKTVELVTPETRSIPLDEASALIIASLKFDALKKDFELLQLKMNHSYAQYQELWARLCEKHNLDPARHVVTELGEVQERS